MLRRPLAYLLTFLLACNVLLSGHDSLLVHLHGDCELEATSHGCKLCCELTPSNEPSLIPVTPAPEACCAHAMHLSLEAQTLPLMASDSRTDVDALPTSLLLPDLEAVLQTPARLTSLPATLQPDAPQVDKPLEQLAGIVLRL